jgi:uncharacterized tellurite resistance protein B-like protein
MAFADGEFHPDEVRVVKAKIKKIFPNAGEHEQKLKDAMEQYSAFDKSKLTELFKDTFAHFSNVKFSQKYKVYTDMYDIINADGTIDESETEALDSLKKIIDLGVEQG